jgi:hypothetical protein
LIILGIRKKSEFSYKIRQLTATGLSIDSKNKKYKITYKKVLTNSPRSDKIQPSTKTARQQKRRRD